MTFLFGVLGWKLYLRRRMWYLIGFSLYFVVVVCLFVCLFFTWEFEWFAYRCITLSYKESHSNAKKAIKMKLTVFDFQVLYRCNTNYQETIYLLKQK